MPRSETVWRGLSTLFLTDTSMQVLEGYINHIRTFLKPNCDYVLVTRNGGQHNKPGEVMSKLVFDATGKYVHPTRYRQIVETASSRSLSSSAQDAISEDQKHSSVVARVHYQKRRSREVASKAHAFLERLQGERGSELEMTYALGFLRIQVFHKNNARCWQNRYVF